MNYIIREMRETEYPLLKDFLYEAIFIPEGAEAHPRSILENPELQVYIAGFGTQKHDRALVAEADNKAVGAVWVRIMNDYGHVDEETPSFAISLYKDYRGFGIGTEMMKRMLAVLKDCGYRRASLAVQKANYAVKLYQKAGFEIVRESEEEYIMVKRLSDILEFTSREEFRSWLAENCQSSDGVWLLFGKAGGPKTIKAGEALEEALCFGWIDGQMEKLDEKSYKKYFAQRRERSKWSEKNKALVKKLEERGLMTGFGRAKIEEARKNGQWDAQDLMTLTEEQIARVSALLEGHEPAFTNFQAMPPSVRKTYARAYYDAKTDAGREKRLAWMVDRLNKNLRPM